MKILLTAFVPFNNDSINPSLGALERINCENIEKLILPVSYEKAKTELLKVLELGKYDFVISLGYAAKRDVITIEEVSYNETKASIPDNDGVLLSEGVVVKGGASTLETLIDVDKLVDNLGEYKVRKSLDPGRFICNEVYYLALLSQAGNALFIHLPHISRSMDNVLVVEKIINLIKGDFKK